jgi:glycosyltransferase involved in cell wall biosynthesis
VPGTLRIIHQVDELRAALEGQARDRGLGNRIQFEGALPPEQIAQVLAGATALVLPSDMEALPSVVTEALLVGTPVVATDVGGVREQIGSNGYVVERGNRGALAHALRAVLNERDRWLSATPEIRADARLRFGVDRMVDDHLALYQSLGATRRDPRRRRSLLRPIAAAGRVAFSGR